MADMKVNFVLCFLDNNMHRCNQTLHQSVQECVDYMCCIYFYSFYIGLDHITKYAMNINWDPPLSHMINLSYSICNNHYWNSGRWHRHNLYKTCIPGLPLVGFISIRIYLFHESDTFIACTCY